MKTKIRIFIVPLLLAFFALFLLLWNILTPHTVYNRYPYIPERDTNRIGTILDISSGYKIDQLTARESYRAIIAPKENEQVYDNQIGTEECNLISCFNFSRCLNGFSVYVYKPSATTKLSPLYSKIMQVVSESPYATTDPLRACLLLPPYDTLDRDPLSADYKHGYKDKLSSLPYWNHGYNHFIFNFFSGTSPSYSHSLASLNIEFGKSILIKASSSNYFHRRDFDISSPLLPKDFKLTDRIRVHGTNGIFPVSRKYLVTFKGKRYVWGVGSVARNALFNLHNYRDIVLLTTCIHGRYWYKYEDRMCKNDNAIYTEYEFSDLMVNSSFCLVPRGRRLGSFRFLESLQFGCVPVSLSNGYVLPFSEVIDWKLASVDIDERNLFQVPIEVQSVPTNKLLAMRMQSHFLWDTYLSSTTKFVNTVLEILKDRIYSHFSRTYAEWNFPPGAIFNQMPDLNNNNNNNNLFTAVVHIHVTINSIMLTDQLSDLIKCVDLFELILLTEQKFQFKDTTKIRIISNTDFKHFKFQTNAILYLEFSNIPTPRDIEFGFYIWQQFPLRLVGYTSYSHLWDNNKEKWTFDNHNNNNNNNNNNNSNNNKHFSMVSIFPAFFHRSYLSLYSKNKTLDLSIECEIIGFNFYVSHVCKCPPILISGALNPLNTPFVLNATQLQSCIDYNMELYEYNPLVYSEIYLSQIGTKY